MKADEVFSVLVILYRVFLFFFFLTYYHQFIMKDTTQEQPDGRNTQGKFWETVQSVRVLSRYPLSEHLDVQQPGSSGFYFLVPRLARCALITNGDISILLQTELSTIYMIYNNNIIYNNNLSLPGSATIQSNLLLCHLIFHKII